MLYEQFLESRMESEAEFGLFYIYAKITKKKAKELSNLGFEVKDSMESKGFPRIHKISWKNTSLNLPINEICKLNENNPNYSFVEKLYIITVKNQPKK